MTRWPFLLALALGLTTMTASADHAATAEPPEPPAAPRLTAPDPAIDAGLLVDLYAGAYSSASSRRSTSLNPPPR